jgi:hypothetical protein
MYVEEWRFLELGDSTKICTYTTELSTVVLLSRAPFSPPCEHPREHFVLPAGATCVCPDILLAQHRLGGKVFGGAIHFQLQSPRLLMIPAEGVTWPITSNKTNRVVLFTKASAS